MEGLQPTNLPAHRVVVRFSGFRFAAQQSLARCEHGLTSFRVAGWRIEQSPEAKSRADIPQSHSQIKDCGATYHGFQHARSYSLATTLIPQLYSLICRVKLKYG